jgi:chromate transporter
MTSSGGSSAAEAAQAGPRPPLSLPRMLALFLKVGAIGFGGGMAVIALMEREFVENRRVLRAEEFLHGVGLSQILGPFAVNTAFFVGHRRHGLLGALAATVAFLLPSVGLVILLSFLYFRYHAIPALQGVLQGVGPVVIALILAAAWSMGRKALASVPAVLLALAGAGAGAFGLNAVWVLLAAGLLGLAVGRARFGDKRGRNDAAGAGEGSGARPPSPARGFVPLAAPMSAVAGVGSVSLTGLGLAFLKVGLVFFGGGFVLVPILHQQLVERLHWLGPQEFLDGVAISNLTPGPIAVLSTFAGYRLLGVPGALVATAALFAPALALMAIICLGYERLRDAERAYNFLAGVAPAVVGLVASAALVLWPSAILSWRALLLAAVALLLLVRFRWPPVLVLALGAGLAAAGLVP